MLERICEHACFGGVQGFYRHASGETGLPMRFSVYQPQQARNGPVLFYLAGLTCTEETFMIKAGTADSRDFGHGALVLALRRHPDYDHGYYFISTFMEDHLAFHRRNLRS